MAIAALFSGQGSQSVGMLAELANSFPIVTETFQQASDSLGYDLWHLVQEGPDSELNKTTITQPAMLAAGVAVWRVWLQQGGIEPKAGAGHSLGEYSALVAANCLDFVHAVHLVTERARLMQSAVPAGAGAMAAVLGAEDAQIIQVCADISAQGEIVEAVNFNSPGQVVIAGQTAAVDKALAALVELGAKKSVKLPVSVPSHCSLMQEASFILAKELSQTLLNAPEFTVLHNVDAQPRTSSAGVRAALAEQLYKPVRWTQTIEALRDQYNTTLLLEFGPGRTLTSLNRRIDRKLNALAIYDNASLEAALKAVSEGTV
ncbi:MAG: ACP S-malonyltransferase [Thiofilum sp.]|uniref:ACP S-malonyltransferase n=1 Tax=Thiofilum sp. TaxID=2212733 RepID=UPI0025E8E3F1|nr:ACP S-malonyltransferase [Thiofilum sp.]MBK8454504.1 ACP S-malonyltransferase [Thiofilum sp.]